MKVYRPGKAHWAIVRPVPLAWQPQPRQQLIGNWPIGTLNLTSNSVAFAVALAMPNFVHVCAIMGSVVSVAIVLERRLVK